MKIKLLPDRRAAAILKTDPERSMEYAGAADPEWNIRSRKYADGIDPEWNIRSRKYADGIDPD